MALSDLSFKLYTDAGLTTEYGGSTTLTHESDFTDNPQDIQLWFGSTISNRRLQTLANSGVDNIELTPTDILPEWVASTAYIVGDSIEPTVDNTYRYVCSVGGTSSGTEPATWNTSVGGTTVDGSVTWVTIAKSHQPDEIKLAVTAVGLDGATGGAALALGTTVLGGVANAVEINIRVTNTVSTVSTNVGSPELALYINEVIETAI